MRRVNSALYAYDRQTFGMEASKVIGARIKRLREEMGLSQPVFAERVGVTQPSMSNIERGTTKQLRGPTVAGICRELNISPSALLKATPDDLSPNARATEAEMLDLWREIAADDQAVLLTTARAFRDRRLPARRATQYKPTPANEGVVASSVPREGFSPPTDDGRGPKYVPAVTQGTEWTRRQSGKERDATKTPVPQTNPRRRAAE